ncbi:hypothetical protein LIER_21249 [Lithospermum erythrorhizon]|uniref:Uncharacterized protein n=1 Tax=Lithospermum erythrorhizon TaxID=34254 RepID=A0AAV3QQK5_LITER
MERVTRLGPGPQASHEVSRLWLQVFSTLVVVLCHCPSLSLLDSLIFPLFPFQATSTFRELAEGNASIYQQSLELSEGLSWEGLKVEALKQELQGLRIQSSHLPPLGGCFADPEPVEGHGEMGCSFPGCSCCPPGEGGLETCLRPRHPFEMPPHRCCYPIGLRPELIEKDSNTPNLDRGVSAAFCIHVYSKPLILHHALKHGGCGPSAVGWIICGYLSLPITSPFSNARGFGSLISQAIGYTQTFR